MQEKKVSQDEIIFYKDKSVIVSQSRFIANSKTYAMSNISSVATNKIEKSKNLPIIVLIFGIIFMFSGGSGIIIGVAMVGISILIFRNSKNDYSVQLSSNSGDSQALVSSNKEYIQKIVDAVNKAIIYRG